MKRIIAYLVVVLTLFLSSVTVFANVGVSEKNPMENSDTGISNNARSTRIPNNWWDLARLGQYDFSGSSRDVNLYTDYYFSGQESYYTHVMNESKTQYVTVYVKTRFKTYDSRKVTPASGAYFTTTGISKKAGIYLLFNNGGFSSFTFSGYIK